MRSRAVRCAAVAAVLLLAACSDLDVVTATYGTLAEARQAGAVSAGRIPDGLPAGTREMREAYGESSKRRWGLFNFPPAEGDQLKALLDTSEVSLQNQEIAPPRRIEWWPVLLRGPLDAQQLAATGLRTYKSRSGDLTFAVNWNQGRAYYWSAATK